MPVPVSGCSAIICEDTSVEAARLRFRPICMTSLAFCLGILPLVIATGAGAASRHALGTGLIGGMIAATTLALFFVPLFFYILESFNQNSKLYLSKFVDVLKGFGTYLVKLNFINFTKLKDFIVKLIQRRKNV